MTDARDKQIRQMQEQLDALKKESGEPAKESPSVPPSSGMSPGCALLLAIGLGLWLSGMATGLVGFFMYFIAPDIAGLIDFILFFVFSYLIGNFFYKALLPNKHARTAPTLVSAIDTTVHDEEDTSADSQDSKPAKSTKPELTTEQWIGRHGLSYLGIALLVIGISFLIAYALPSVGAVGRIAVGIISAIIIIAFSRYAEKRSLLFGQLLYAGGVGTLYFTTYAMNGYDSSRILSGSSAAMIDAVLLFIVAIGSTLYTLNRYHTQAATILSYLLIYITVFIQAPVTNELNIFTVTTLLLATTGLVYLGWKKEWKEALIVGAVASYTGYWGLSLNTTAGFNPLDPIFLTIFFLLFSLPFLDVAKKELRTIFLGMHPINTLIYALLLGTSLDHFYTHGAAWLLIVIATCNYLYGYYLGQQKERDFEATCFSIANIALVVAIPMLFTGASITLSWLLIGAVMVLTGIINKYSEFTWIGITVFVLAVLRYEFIDLIDPAVIANTPITIRAALGLVGTVVSFLLAGQVEKYKNSKNNLTDDTTWLKPSFNTVALTMSASMIAVDFNANLISLGWGILGIVALMIGFARKDVQLRGLSFVLLTIMLVRIVLIDLASAGTLMRIVSFIVLGLILLGVSWFYYYEKQKKDGTSK